jgi:NAD(P)-dependent dehydrogenase (short-subunit alcohol dehydrogenase family)
MKQKLLEDKIVMVTGASRGIGKGIATQLGKYGATVYVTGRTLGLHVLFLLSCSVRPLKRRSLPPGIQCAPNRADSNKQ